MGFAALTAVVHHIGTDTIAAIEPRFGQALEVALGVREARAPDARLLGEAILAALNAAAGDTNLLVTIDDLQALDPSSAVVLSYVARRLARSKVRLVGAARSDDAPLFEGAGIGALQVQPLPSPSAEALLSHQFPRLSTRAQARILEQAAGNPLALIELPTAGADVTHGLSSDALPLTRRLQAVFARRLDGLSSTARALLLLCALEPSISLGELQQLGHAAEGSGSGCDRHRAGAPCTSYSARYPRARREPAGGQHWTRRHGGPVPASADPSSGRRNLDRE